MASQFAKIPPVDEKAQARLANSCRAAAAAAGSMEHGWNMEGPWNIEYVYVYM